MAQFEITVQETRTYTVVVDADSREDAVKAALGPQPGVKKRLMRRTPVAVSRLMQAFAGR